MTQLRYGHLFTGPAGQPQPDDRLVLVRALRRLPVNQRAVLVLRHFEDLPESEVARVLGLPLGTVKSLNRRGLALLRQAPDVAAMLPASTDVRSHNA
jgi:DNA-directed RNA polymerase specialized sigma24 family protein